MAPSGDVLFGGGEAGRASAIGAVQTIPNRNTDKDLAKSPLVFEDNVFIGWQFVIYVFCSSGLLEE